MLIINIYVYVYIWILKLTLKESAADVKKSHFVYVSMLTIYYDLI